MARYIDADALMEYVEKTDWYSILRGNMTVGAENSEKAWYKAADIYAAIEIAPTIEARPVVRGEWEHMHDFIFNCTNCGSIHIVETCMGIPKWKYCPNCGADMRGDDDGK